MNKHEIFSFIDQQIKILQLEKSKQELKKNDIEKNILEEELKTKKGNRLRTRV